jgi:hypothetical protein
MRFDPLLSFLAVVFAGIVWVLWAANVAYWRERKKMTEAERDGDDDKWGEW